MTSWQIRRRNHIWRDGLQGKTQYMRLKGCSSVISSPGASEGGVLTMDYIHFNPEYYHKHVKHLYSCWCQRRGCQQYRSLLEDWWSQTSWSWTPPSPSVGLRQVRITSAAFSIKGVEVEVEVVETYKYLGFDRKPNNGTIFSGSVKVFWEDRVHL